MKLSKKPFKKWIQEIICSFHIEPPRIVRFAEGYGRYDVSDNLFHFFAPSTRKKIATTFIFRVFDKNSGEAKVVLDFAAIPCQSDKSWVFREGAVWKPIENGDADQLAFCLSKSKKMRLNR